MAAPAASPPPAARPEPDLLTPGATLRDELARRVRILRATEHDAALAAKFRVASVRSWRFFVENFGWVCDHRAQPAIRPFLPWQHQIATGGWLDERLERREDGIVEKSRDMGATWTVVSWLFWRWLFTPNFSALVGSYKEDRVDDGTVATPFGMIDFMRERLPGWLFPPGFAEKDRSHMSILSPRTGSAIVGESTNPRFGRGGRYSVIVLDEFAHVERSELIWESASQASDCKIAVSTPHGRAGAFARLRWSSALPVLTLDWRRHPNKSQDWYARQKASLLPEQIAQEIDISYDRSVRGRLFPELDRARCVPSDGAWREIAGSLFRGCELYEGWDFGTGPSPTVCSWVFYDRANGALYLDHAEEHHEHDADWWIELVRRSRAGYARTDGRKIERSFADPAGRNRESDQRSWFTRLRAGGIELMPAKPSPYDAIRQTRALLRAGKLFVSPHARHALECLESARWDVDDEKAAGDWDAPRAKVRKDWASHVTDTLLYVVGMLFAPTARGGVQDW